MATKALIFMPFDPNASSYAFIRVEYAENGGGFEKNKKVKEYLVSKGYTVEVAWYDGKKLPAVSSFNTGEIYIRGHGKAGDPTIKGAKSWAENVRYDTAFERLKQSGLPKAFQGQIHCYNCHSAEHGANGGEPYAVLFSNHMYSKGYKSCSYYGYLGPLDSFAKEGSQGVNIYSRGKEMDELGTWDQARVTIHPTVNLMSNTQKFKALFK